jgi:hypothetical protein
MKDNLDPTQRLRVENIVGMYQRGEIPRPNVHWLLAKDLVQHRGHIADLEAKAARLRNLLTELRGVFNADSPLWATHMADVRSYWATRLDDALK